MSGNPFIIPILVIILILVVSVTLIIDETQCGVITRLGNPVRTLTEPGLYFKLPFPIEAVAVFNDRLLNYDSAPTEIITRDKKNLVVDNYAMWRIVNPLLFLKTVADENGAQSRLDDIIYSILREHLGKYELTEIVSTKRAEIMEGVTVQATDKAKAYGIELRDVRIKRADLPKENAKYVYERMRAERVRKANMYRSEGEEEAVKIRAETDKQKVIIMANAYRDAERIRGRGDSLAAAIYADAYSRSPKFYSFLRSMEAYKTSMNDGTVLVLPADSKFLGEFK